MAKTGNRKRKTATPQFILEFDTKGIIIFLVLVILTGLSIFYLGVIFGKAMRNPNAAISLPSGLEEVEEKTPKKTTPPKDLKVYDIRDDDEQEMRNFKKDLLSISREADDLIKKTGAGKTEKTKKVSVVEQPVKREPKPKTTNWPEVSGSSSGGKVYTIQVMATKDRGKAKAIMGQLQQNAFDAYITEITIQGKKIYRVRVGKRNRQQINKLKKKLEPAVRGLGKLQVIEIQ